MVFVVSGSGRSMTTGKPRGVRERVLDAAEARALEVGLSALRVGQVAERAGVSRQTVYNEFGGKIGLAEAVAVRTAERLVQRVEEVIAEVPSLPEAVTAAVAFGLRAAQDEPLIAMALRRKASDDLITLLTTNAEPVLLVTRQRLVDMAGRLWPDLHPDDVALGAEVATRLVVGHLVCPTEPVDVLAGHVGKLVAALTATRG